MLYHIAANLEGKQCLVVGGGAVGARKAKTLAQAKAAITLVAPEVLPKIEDMARDGALVLKKRGYRTDDVVGKVFVFAATNDKLLNEVVAKDAKAAGALVNVADAPEICDFFVPATLRLDEVSVAVSSSGVSPAFSAWLRDRIEAALPKGIDKLVKLLPSIRKSEKVANRKDFWPKLFDSGVLELLEAGEDEKAAKVVSELVDSLD